MNNNNWWLYFFVVLIIIIFIIFVIKILIEFPGLLAWRLNFDDGDQESIQEQDHYITMDELDNDIARNSKNKAKTISRNNNHRKCSKEEKNEEEDIEQQSTVDKHALLSNFMSS